jgi:putative peptidoglycan lipid II flippase
VLAFYVIGLVPYGYVYIQLRASYALGRTAVPLVAAVFAVATNVGLDLALVGTMQEGGLALATALAGFVNAGVLLFFLRAWTPWRALVRRIGLVALGTAGMSAVVWGCQRLLDPAPLVVATLGPAVGGIVTYALFIRCTGLWRLVRRSER